VAEEPDCDRKGKLVRRKHVEGPLDNGAIEVSALVPCKCGKKNEAYRGCTEISEFKVYLEDKIQRNAASFCMDDEFDRKRLVDVVVDALLALGLKH
jgi:hypothetical protein